MKKIFIKLVIMMGLCVANNNLAQANQMNQVAALKIAHNGVFKDTHELTQIALNKHLGSHVTSGCELKKIYGRYIYRVALLDTKKIRWNVDLDAETGEVVSNMID